MEVVWLLLRERGDIELGTGGRETPGIEMRVSGSVKVVKVGFVIVVRRDSNELETDILVVLARCFKTCL
jgi:hypothetical protein